MTVLPDRLRQCVTCRSLKPRSELFRITFSAQTGAFSFDNTPFLQGRSVYVCRNPDCIRVALKGKKLQKALKRPLPGDIVECLRQASEG